MGYGKSKSGGFTGNMTKLGGGKKKLRLSSDMRTENMANVSMKKATKQAHKKV